MDGGEVFVPKIPSTTVADIAKAVAPDCETKVIGIRPGEKLHECMVPTDEARQTLEFDDHFIIQPIHRTWSITPPSYVELGRPCAPDFSYASDNNQHWLSIGELESLIAECCPEFQPRKLRIAA